MDLAHVLPWISRNAGGLFYSVSGLAKAQQRLNEMRVEVFGSRDPFSSQDVGQWVPLTLHLAQTLGPRRLCYTPEMRGMLEMFRPDLVHSAAVWTYQAAVVNQLHRKHRSPFMLSTRGTLDSWALANSSWKKRIALLVFQQEHFDRAACIHALNQGEAESIRKFGLKNPICVIPNGIELPPEEKQNLKPEAGDLSGGSKAEGGNLKPEQNKGGRKVLLYLGRIHPKKGLVNLLRAWAETLRNRRTGLPSDWMLVIAGWDEGGHEAELKQLATELGIRWTDCRQNSSTGSPTHQLIDSPSSLLFVGPQFGERKAAWYGACDAFVLPSFSEGLPMVVLEAWAHEKPVLMTPECNIPEGFEAGAAIRIEPSVETIVKGLNTLFDCSRADLLSLGEKGRGLVERRFAWPVIAREMKEVYDWVLGGGAAPATVRR